MDEDQLYRRPRRPRAWWRRVIRTGRELVQIGILVALGLGLLALVGLDLGL